MKRPTLLLLILLMVMATGSYAGTRMKVVRFKINPSDWTHQPPDVTALSFRVEDKGLTQEIFENGTVQIYFLGTSGGGWWPLPYTFPTGSGIPMSFNYLPGYAEVRIYDRQPNTTFHYKMVILSNGK